MASGHFAGHRAGGAAGHSSAHGTSDLPSGVVLPSPVATVLTEASSSVDGASIASAVIAPLPDQVLYAAVAAVSGTVATQPTASGNGLTWVLVESIALDAVRQLTVFRAQGAAPSAGAVTFDFGGVTQTSFIWAVIQYAGADASGSDGAGATPQSEQVLDASGTSISITLPGPLAGAGSRMLVFVQTVVQGAAVVPDADFAELTDRSTSVGSHSMESQHAINQTNCVATYGSSGAVAIAIEVKAA